MRHYGFAVLVGFVALVVASQGFSGGIYKWVDRDGSVHFSDGDVPIGRNTRVEQIGTTASSPDDEVTVVSVRGDQNGILIALRNRTSRILRKVSVWIIVKDPAGAQVRDFLKTVFGVKPDSEFKIQVDAHVPPGYVAEVTMIDTMAN
jgi:hypothetical protein